MALRTEVSGTLLLFLSTLNSGNSNWALQKACQICQIYRAIVWLQNSDFKAEDTRKPSELRVAGVGFIIYRCTKNTKDCIKIFWSRNFNTWNRHLCVILSQTNKKQLSASSPQLAVPAYFQNKLHLQFSMPSFLFPPYSK